MERMVYRFGAGKLPPLLAGRDPIIHAWQRTLDEVAHDGRTGAEDLLLTGPRGVGKTCAMTALSQRARAMGYEVVSLQAVKDERTLVGSLLRQADHAIAHGRGPWGRARQAFERFAGGQLGVAGVSVGITLRESKGAERDPESLAAAVADLARAARAASPAGTGGAMLTIDELQVGNPAELALISAALQRLNVDHPDAPVTFVSTGLPHTMQRLIDAGVTHPERLFAETRIPLQLDLVDARAAIVEPARAAGVIWDPRAVDAVVEAANRYPAHLQFFAGSVWRAATDERVTREDADRVLPAAADELTVRSLDPRWDEMSPREAELLTAVAVAGGRAPVRLLETMLGRGQTLWSRTRRDLIDAGDLYAPRRGELEIAVPALAQHALRRYPDLRRSIDMALVDLEAMRAALGTAPHSGRRE